jgi:DNA-directed RNA polymerase II subunit RPB1
MTDMDAKIKKDKVKEIDTDLAKLTDKLKKWKPLGEYKDSGNWLIETDGVALQKVAMYDEIDYNRTVSNHLIEIL